MTTKIERITKAYRRAASYYEQAMSDCWMLERGYEPEDFDSLSVLEIEEYDKDMLKVHEMHKIDLEEGDI